MAWLVVMEGDCVEMEEIGPGFAHDFRGWVSNMLAQNSNPPSIHCSGSSAPTFSVRHGKREITGDGGGRERKSVFLSALGWRESRRRDVNAISTAVRSCVTTLRARNDHTFQ